jgi:hypothetical protein
VSIETVVGLALIIASLLTLLLVRPVKSWRSGRYRRGRRQR